MVALAFAAHAVLDVAHRPGHAARSAGAAVVFDRMRRVRCLYRRDLLPARAAPVTPSGTSRTKDEGLAVAARPAVDLSAGRAAAPRAGGAAQAGRLHRRGPDARRLSRPYGGLLQHGLKRLTSEGAWYTKAAYPYLNTITCVGHSTIGTGSLPYKHGMIANSWYDRDTAKIVTCNADPDTQRRQLWRRHRDRRQREEDDGADAGRGDGRRAQVPGGHDVDEGPLGDRPRRAQGRIRHVVRRQARVGNVERLHAGAGRVVRRLPEGQSGSTWTPARHGSAPCRSSATRGTDDAPGERGTAGWTATFPHPLGAAGDTAYYAHLQQSPYMDEQLEAMAEAAVDQMSSAPRTAPTFSA